MKNPIACCLFLCSFLPAAAAQPSPPHANNKSVPKPSMTAPVSTQVLAPLTKKPEGTPPPAASSATVAPSAPPTPKGGVTLDAYVATLADDVPLSKDEQTDVKTYYLNDGAKLQEILNDPSLSPLQQLQQVDDLRNVRNSKIEALLKDVGRQQEFLKVESDYRVALVELAAQGGLIPTSPTPNVPQPTATTPAQADAAVQATAHTEKADAAPGQ